MKAKLIGTSLCGLPLVVLEYGQGTVEIHEVMASNMTSTIASFGPLDVAPWGATKVINEAARAHHV